DRRATHAGAELRATGLRSKLRQRSARRYAAERSRARRNEVHEARQFRRERRPPADAAHRPGLTRTAMMLVVVRQELRLVRRHVGVRGTVAAAALAGEAPLQGLLHFLARPALGND